MHGELLEHSVLELRNNLRVLLLPTTAGTCSHVMEPSLFLTSSDQSFLHFQVFDTHLQLLYINSAPQETQILFTHLECFMICSWTDSRFKHMQVLCLTASVRPRCTDSSCFLFFFTYFKSVCVFLLNHKPASQESKEGQTGGLTSLISGSQHLTPIWILIGTVQLMTRTSRLWRISRSVAPLHHRAEVTPHHVWRPKAWEIDPGA